MNRRERRAAAAKSKQLDCIVGAIRAFWREDDPDGFEIGRRPADRVVTR
jgi:hypothetical protein